MPLVVNSNIPSLNAQRQLLQSGAELDKASERLASGRRINSAADDAAGLAISNRQSSQIRGLDQAVRNANDGVSLIQTAEGALDETTNILQRMRELAIQSSNGIYSDTDRATLDAEVQQLKAEIDRIAETTAFNGQNILDGSLGDVALQVGSEANETITFGVDGFTSNSLGGSGGDVIGEATTIAALAAMTTAGDLAINDTNLSTVDAADSLNDVLATYNADLDGKGAEVSALVTFEATTVGDGVLVEGTDTMEFVVLNGDNTTSEYQITGTKNMDELIDKLNAETPLTATLNEAGKLTVSAEGVESITYNETAGDADGATGFVNAAAGTFSLVVNDTSTDGSGLKIEATTGNGTTDAELGALGLNFTDDDGVMQADAVTAAAAASNSINEGDLIINGVEIGAITADTASATATRAESIEEINKLSNETGVVAYENSGAIAFASTSGDPISIKFADSATDADIVALTGLKEQNAAVGSGSIAGVDIGTIGGAQNAIETIDKALEQINSTRSELGAINNRLDFTVSNLSNVSEKTSAARSRIVDADFASETAKLSRAQVLQQASQAMLAQANARPQQVLSLLQ